MSKGRYVKKKKSNIPFWLIPVIAVILIGAVLLLVPGILRDEIPAETEGQSAIQTDAAGGHIAFPVNPEGAASGSAGHKLLMGTPIISRLLLIGHAGTVQKLAISLRGEDAALFS